MIYTTSYFDKKNQHGTLISISSSEPKWFKYDYKFTAFVPKYTLVKAFKQDEISWKEYENQYRNNFEINKVEEFRIAMKQLKNYIGYDDCTLLCWCKNVAICHRIIVADILKSVGLTVVIK